MAKMISQYIRGHYWQGKKHTKVSRKKMKGPFTLERRANISNALKGKKHTEKWKQEMRKRNIGKGNPFYGKRHSLETKQKMKENHWDSSGTNNPFYGKKHTKKSRQQMSDLLKGHPSWNKGKKASKETRRKQSESHKGHKMPEAQKEKLRMINTGRKHTDGAKLKMRKRALGKNNNNWLGGISFEPYGLEFSKELKISIRERDDYTCQLCGCKETNRRHSVHHIDYNKKNNKLENLITLCVNCHQKTSYNRKYWTIYLQGTYAGNITILHTVGLGF